ELVEQPRDPARRALAFLFLLVGLVADARREHETCRVGRPRDLLRTLLQLGQLARLTAVGGDHVELRCLVLAALRREREPAPVRRPARRRVATLARGELPRRRGCVQGADPDRAAVFALLLVDRPDLVRDEAAG